MRLKWMLLVVCCVIPMTMRAQDCPKENPEGPSKESISRTLTGKVVYHDEIRKWFGLVLDSPTCQQDEIQLLPGGNESNYHAIDVVRECRAMVDGVLGIATTGYYSTDVYQTVERITVGQGCVRRPELPDYSKAKPDKSVRSYRVSMLMDYKARGGKIDILVRSGSRLLTPWPAYASYTLTGDYAFYATCAEGFSLSHFRGTPQANPWTMENQAMMDPESAAEKHIRRITLTFACRR